MPYQVMLRRKDGAITTSFKMYNAVTPSPGEIINVYTDPGTVKARVTDRASARPVDLVTAIEI